MCGIQKKKELNKASATTQMEGIEYYQLQGSADFMFRNICGVAFVFGNHKVCVCDKFGLGKVLVGGQRSEAQHTVALGNRSLWVCSIRSIGQW